MKISDGLSNGGVRRCFGLGGAVWGWVEVFGAGWGCFGLGGAVLGWFLSVTSTLPGHTHIFFAFHALMQREENLNFHAIIAKIGLRTGKLRNHAGKIYLAEILCFSRLIISALQ